MNRRQQETIAKLNAAMTGLLGYPHFAVFADTLRELREGAVAYAVEHTTVKDERESLAALGEIRAYGNILSIVDGAKDRLEEEASMRDQDQAPQ